MEKPAAATAADLAGMFKGKKMYKVIKGIYLNVRKLFFFFFPQLALMVNSNVVFRRCQSTGCRIRKHG